ncbi:uncharacterized protein LOC142947839 [Anarhichas minor]|uniref:uncharacterized protein LOC142947839 n=1 Tax=Anarhichas minor TaxID=65739 RepID=UPI003F73240E
MSKVQMLKAFVNQRLTAAAEEIFHVFERTIAEYEDTLEFTSRENHRQRKLLEAAYNPEVRLHRADVQQLLVVTEEFLPEQQEWISSLDQDHQEDPEPPHIKEEQEELWTSQGGELLQGLEEADIKFPFAPVPVLSGEDEETAAPEETRQSSEPETDVSSECEETRGPRSGSNPLRNKEAPSRDTKRYTGKTSTSNRFSGFFCRTSFGSSSSLVQHVRVHAGEKSCTCSVCGQRFSRKSSLLTHMRHHSDGKRFSCSLCKTSFGSSSKLSIHMRIHTGEKPFSCPVCSKRFAIHGNLRRHLKVHTGEKAFSCSLCSKRFTQKGHLRQHLVVHTGERPFSCSFCSKRFTQHSNLRRHLAVHTHTGQTIQL